MRRIKFRIWNGKTKQWIHGPHEMPSMDGVNLFGETILFGDLLGGVSIEDLNEIVALQYTGLDDKNGKGIFEGDIISFTYHGNKMVFQGVVKWTGCGFGFDRHLCMANPLACDNLEVTGNIFDDGDPNAQAK